MRKIRIIVVGLVVGMTLKTFVCDFHKIDGTSMIPALMPQSIVFENKLAYGLVKPFGTDFFVQWKEPKTGDVVFYVHNNRTVVKRVMAVGGEALEISAESGYSLCVHDTKIPLSEFQYERFKYITKVPDGMILAIGDNYADSIDSRDYGFVSTANVLGKVLWK